MARVLLYCQSLQGVGHYMRSRAIARALARAGQMVWLVNGGRHVPETLSEPRLHTVRLPAASHQRRRWLEDLIEQVQPHVLMVEHFPFGKYAFEEEILGAIAVARRCSPGARILCSVRDLPISKELGSLTQEQQERRIAPLLTAHFDGLFVHTDPVVCRLDENFPWIRHLPLPVQYTGYVAQADPARIPLWKASTDERATVVVSSGGLGDQGVLSRSCRDAWALLSAEAVHPLERMVIFAPLGVQSDGSGAPELPGLEYRAFDTAFLELLAGANLSISQSGYNTTVSLLQLGVRHILVPSGRVKDQEQRARRFATLGLSTVLNAEELDPVRLVETIQDTLQREPKRLAINLDGAAETARRVIALAWR